MTALPAPVLAAALAVPGSLAVLGWALLARTGGSVARARTNLTRGFDQVPVGPVTAAGRPQVAGLVRSLTPAGTVRRVDRLLGTAGRPAEWPVARVVTAKLVLGAAGAGVGLLLLAASPGVPTLLLGLATAALAYVVPELLLYSRGQERQKAIGLELADTLDQMTIAVEAGLGFESAMDRAGRNGRGPLAEELVRTLQDIAYGQPRREAYLALADRTGVPDLRRFIRSVVQADQYGVSIADVLRAQAHEMRLKRRQKAEEKAMQIPVKVIFPLILCILPVLFIVLLGPAALDIAHSL